MFSVALIGADGAGKTTLAKKLEKDFPLPLKYQYMGINVGSSNVASPLARLINAFKKDEVLDKETGAPKIRLTLDAKGQKAKKKNAIRAGLRFFNRFLDEWYRQFLAWKLKRRGNILIYDRHFAFDFELGNQDGLNTTEPFFDWLHRWCLAKFYPRPNLVIFLDAPAEVLYARKREATLEYLESRRTAFLNQGKKMDNFIKVDATQSLDVVYNQVENKILAYSDKEHNIKITGEKSYV